MRLEESRLEKLEFCDKKGNVCASNVSLFRHMSGDKW